MSEHPLNIAARSPFNPRLYIAALACLSAPASLHAQDRWVLVHEDVLQRIYIDTLSVRNAADSSVYVGWFKWSFREPQKQDSLTFVMMITRNEVACRDRRFRLHQVEFFD